MLFEYALFLQKHNQFSKAISLYEEALEIRRKLAKENPNAFLPYVATTLNNLAIFYLYDRPDKELSKQYANEAIEVLGKCNDTLFVIEQIEKAKNIIEEWNKGQ